MKHEDTARNNHRAGNNCAVSVYTAFSDVNSNPGPIPAPRSDGGKCGAYLAGIKLFNDMDAGDAKEFEKEFLNRFGSIKCGELRKSKVPCNDLVGGAAEIVDEMIKDRK